MSVDTAAAADRRKLSDAHANLLGMLHEARANVQDLQRSLREIRTARETGGIDDAELKTLVADSNELYRNNRKEVEELFAAAHESIEEHPKLREWCGDTVATLENAFERVQQQWPERVDDDLLVRVKRSDELINEMLGGFAQLTIAERLNDHLRTVRLGQPLDFHAIFADEIPDAEQRQEILRMLGDHPLGLEGVLDVESGKAYRVLPSGWKLATSQAAPVLVLVLGAVALWIASHLDDWFKIAETDNNYPDKLRDVGPLLGSYVFVALGAAVHLAIGAFRRRRSQPNEPLVVGGLLAWLHVRWASISMSTATIFLAVLGLAVAGKTDWFAAFFVGYSLDSVVGAFLDRFNTDLTAKSKEVTKKLT